MPQSPSPVQRIHSFIGSDYYWLTVGLLPFFFAAPHTSSGGYFQVGKLLLLGAVALFTAGYLTAYSGRFRLSVPGSVLWAVLGYLGWMTLSNTLWSSQPSYTVIGWPGWRGGLLTNALYWLLLLLALWRPRGDTDSRPAPLLLGFLGVAALWSTAEFLGARPLLGNPHLGFLQGNFSVTAFPILTVGNTGWISGLWPLLAPLALLFAWQRRFPALLGTLVLLLLGVASTQGNLSALVVMGLLIIFAGLTVRRAPLAAVAFALATVLTLPTSAVLADYSHKQNQFTAQTTSQTTGERLVIFKSALKTAAERPLTGWGYETFQNSFYRNIDLKAGEELLRSVVSATPDERVSVSGTAVIAQKEVDGQTVTREATLLMVKPHNYLIEEVYSNGFTALLFLLPLAFFAMRELLRAKTELAYLAFFAWLGYGGYLMGWFLNPSVTPLALAVLALGLRSADRRREAEVLQHPQAPGPLD